MAITLRPAQAQDDELLYRVYASTRTAEMALLGWSADEQEAFLRMQWRAQRQGYALQAPGAPWLVVEQGGRPVGRMIVDRAGDAIRLMDIGLLPEWRGQGVGTALLVDLLAEAVALGRPVRLHVEPFNPALRLYARFGFRRIAEHGLYLELEWQPMLESLTRDAFAKHLHTPFRVLDDPAAPIDLTLAEVSELKLLPRQEVFSLLFHGPSECFLPQGIHNLQHERLGELGLFLVPVGRDEAGFTYQAVFNRLVEARS